MKTENTPSEEYYPGIEYQELFNAIADTKGIAIESDMKDIIAIVHRCFPKEQPAAMSAEEILKQKIDELSQHNGWYSSYKHTDQDLKDAMLAAMEEYAQQSQPAAGMKWVKEFLGLEEAWPLINVLEKLVEATNILLHKKSYDGHGWEDINHCVARGEQIIKNLNSLHQQYLSQCPPNMFTREQMEDAYNAGKRREWADHFGQVPNRHLTFSEFINSLTQQP